MAEKYRFMDAVQDEFGVYDREYNAQEFTDYFKALVTTGVMKGAGNQLAVSANGSNMITKVDTGIAFILGRYYENDSFKELTHDTETLGNSRIDRIVVRMDLSTEARYVKSFIKKGVPSTNPVPPALTQTANYYEISLAQVRIVGGQTFIATNAITDERGTNVICPWAGSNILPSFDDNALSAHIEDKMLHTYYATPTINDNVYNVQLDGVNSYYEGLSICIKIPQINTSAMQININGLGNKLILRPLGGLIQAGEFEKNAVFTLRYNGTYFMIQGVPTPQLKQVALTPWAGWSANSTYGFIVAKDERKKLVYVSGALTKSSTSTVTLAQLPEGYRPSITDRIPIRIATSTKNIDGHLLADGTIAITTSSDLTGIANAALIYFNFSFIINS